MSEETEKTESRPVSAALEREVREKARRRGAVVWLDRYEDYTDFVDRLVERSEAGEFPYPVVAYRGSYLEMMLELEDLLDGREPTQMVVHVPGHTQETIVETPLFGVYKAGKRWRKALSTLVEETSTGRVPQEDIQGFLDEEGSDLTLGAADAWLHGQLSAAGGSGSAVLKQIPVENLLEQLLDGESTLDVELEDIRRHLRVTLGVTEDWLESFRERQGGGTRSDVRGVGRAAASWALAGEYVDDLRREPFVERLGPLTELHGELVDTCRCVADHLRQYRPDVYVRLAREFETRLEQEWKRGDASDLGEIDTFPFEEQQIFEAALRALEEGRWSGTIEWAEERDVASCFWVRRDREREDRWELVRRAAELGRLIEEHDRPFRQVDSLEEAVGAYSESVWRVDQAHRRLEQRRTALLRPRLTDFVELRDCLDGVRKQYRGWADELARRFNEICEDRGFLASKTFRQREIFAQKVGPLVDSEEKVALFMVDALRYEMAQELVDELTKEAGSTATLKPRLAELPTRTAVGMNVLAPVAEGGRLQPVFSSKGKVRAFQAHGFQVDRNESRRRMMRHTVGGRTCPGIGVDEILNGSENLTRKIQNAALVVVHTDDIDAAGEQGHGLSIFEKTLTDIRGAIHLLREAGVERFVITSDHGFLLLDETTVRRVGEGKKTTPQARYSTYPLPESDEDRVSVAPTELAYDVDEDVSHFVFPRDTSVFDTGGSVKTFVHGGNSPQERIIPVLEISAGKPGGSTRQFELDAQKKSAVTDMQRIELEVRADQTALDFGGPDGVELALRAPDDPEVEIRLQSVPGAGELRGGSFVAPLGQTVEVFFRATGPRERRVPVELYAPTMGDAVQSRRFEERFPVRGAVSAAEESPETEETTGQAAGSSTGIEALPDDGTREVFQHLVEYREISEADATELLDGPRAFRRFSRHFEDYLEKVSFDVQVSTVNFQKHYERTTGV